MSAAAGLVTPPALPALAVGSVRHTRHRPVRRSFRHSHFQWLVDLEDLPRPRGPLRLLARFDVRDHLDGGRLGGGISGDLTRWLATRGVEVDTQDRMLMLAHARSFGHVFDPLTVFWVLRPDDSLKALVLEVHNTYGERHAYLVDLDQSGRASVDKEFYVSPFNDTSGRYAVTVRLRPNQVRVAVGLERDRARILTAVTSGRLMPATTGNLVTVSVRHLFLTYRVSFLIRWHGIRLWLSRLPVMPRPPRHEETVR